VATPAPTPWWKKRWRRVPFWAWTAGALSIVGVVGALAQGDEHGGGSDAGAATSLVRPIVPTEPAGSVVRTSALAPTSDTTTPDSSTSTSTTAVRAGWTVSGVTDGDTLDVRGPEGTATVRLIGINAPERGECGSDAATAALERLVARGPVTLVRDESDRDRFGRLLRYIENRAGVDVGGALVEGGHALSRRYPPDTARSDYYDRLEKAARSAGRGQWAADACGPANPDASVAIDIRADAAGDDNVNPNDEWVRFTNTSPEPLDVTGWVVADESATHRYTFDHLVLSPGGSVTLYTGCGPDGPDVRYWCNEDSAVWNNAGDTVFNRHDRRRLLGQRRG
jgi:endonuclease YncB( thermonuclease family)